MVVVMGKQFGGWTISSDGGIEPDAELNKNDCGKSTPKQQRDIL